MSAEHITRIAMLWVASHLALICYALLLPMLGPVLWDQAIELALLIIPLFAGFTSAVVTHVMTPVSERARLPRLDRAAVFVSYLFPAAFLILTAIFITIYVRDLADLSFETLKKVIGILESGVGVYVGVIFARLFGYRALER
jgi:hypothetical protein